MGMAIDNYVLVQLIKDAEARNYNRQLDSNALLPLLDPAGWHLIDSLILHEEIAGAKASPEDMQARCRVLMKFTGESLPQVGHLDVNVVVWNKLNECARPWPRTHELSNPDDGFSTVAVTYEGVLDIFRPAPTKKTRSR